MINFIFKKNKNKRIFLNLIIIIVKEIKQYSKYLFKIKNYY